MQGDVVKAAKWLGGCMIAASLILVFGFHPAVTSRTISVNKMQPETQYFQAERMPVAATAVEYRAPSLPGNGPYSSN